MKKLARPVLSTRSGSLPSVGLVHKTISTDREVVVAYDTGCNRNIPGSRYSGILTAVQQQQ